jgi:branched-chain amino acid transport system substrate-binding protein
LNITRIALAATLALALPLAAQAQQAKLKVGLMLPATGTFAALGTAIENGFRLYVTEQGGKLGGREIEFVKVDDESDPWAPFTRVWRWPWRVPSRRATRC